MFLPFFSQSNFQKKKKKFRNTQSVKLFGSRSGPTLVGPGLGPSCLQRLLAKAKVSASEDPGPGTILLWRLIIKINSMAILLPSADSRRIVVSYKLSMCMMYWLTALSKLPKKKCG